MLRYILQQNLISIFLPRDSYAKRGICRHRVSVCVCVCVCVSVTLRYCIKTAKHRITETTPHDSPMTLVFWCQRSWQNSNGITPTGATNAGGVGENSSLSTKNAL